MNISAKELYQQFQDQWDLVIKSDLSEQRLLILELTSVLLRWESQQSSELTGKQNNKRNDYWLSVAQLVERESNYIVDNLASQKSIHLDTVSKNQERLGSMITDIKKTQNEINAIVEQLDLQSADPQELQEKQEHLQSKLNEVIAVKQIKDELSLQLDKFSSNVSMLSLDNVMGLYKKLHKDLGNHIEIDAKIASVVVGNNLVMDEFPKLRNKCHQLEVDIKMVGDKVNNAIKVKQSQANEQRVRL